MHSYFYSTLWYANRKDPVVEFLLSCGERVCSCGVYMYIHVYMQVHEEASGQVCIFFDDSSPFIETGSLIKSGACDSARLAGQSSSGLLLCLLPATALWW